MSAPATYLVGTDSGSKRTLTPRPGGQSTFVSCADEEVVAVSPWGEGKTWGIVFKALLWTQMYPGSTNALLRKKGTWCRETVLPEFMGLVGPAIFTAGWREQPHKWTNPWTKATIVFVGLDEPAAWAGRKLGFVGVDDGIPPLGGTQGEGVNIDEWMAIGVGRMRDPMSYVRQIAMTTNPGPPDHWVLKRAREGKLRLIALETGSNVDPNTGASPIPADYLRRRNELTGVYRARYLHGMWVAAEGLVYCPPWDRRVHCVPPKHFGTFAPKPGFPIELWIDWGYSESHPSCVLFVWKFHSKYVVFDEIYVSGLTARELGKMAAMRHTECPVVRIVPDQNPECIESFLGAAPGRFPRSALQQPEKAVGVGVQTVLEYLAVDGTGEPSLFIDGEHCPNSVVEFESYPWDSRRDRPRKDGTVKDHAMDPIRYGLHTGRFGSQDDEPKAISLAHFGQFSSRRMGQG